MAYDRTRLKAKFFDRERARRLGAGAVLVLLRETARDENGVGTYDALLTPSSGWNAQRVTGKDGSTWTQADIADTTGDVATLMQQPVKDRPTHFALNSQVFKLQGDRTVIPLGEPRIFSFIAYVQTGDTYGG